MRPKLENVLMHQDKQIQETIANSFFDDITDVTPKIRRLTELTAVSDGSVEGNKMSFGWVLNDGDHETATRNGPCDGKPSSL